MDPWYCVAPVAHHGTCPLAPILSARAVALHPSGCCGQEPGTNLRPNCEGWVPRPTLAPALTAQGPPPPPGCSRAPALGTSERTPLWSAQGAPGRCGPCKAAPAAPSGMSCKHATGSRPTRQQRDGKWCALAPGDRCGRPRGLALHAQRHLHVFAALACRRLVALLL